MWKFTRIDFFFKLLCGRGFQDNEFFRRVFWEWFVLTNIIFCGLGKKSLDFELWWKITWFLSAFFSCLREGLVVSFFSTFWRNIYCFLMVVTGSKCLVDIWKRVHKKSEASDAFSAWCFFGLSEVAFFSSSLFVSSNFSCIWSLFALNMPKCFYMFVNRHSVINWSPKKGNEWFWKMKFCAICGNLLELNFSFKLLCGRGFQDNEFFRRVFGNDLFLQTLYFVD